MTALLLLFLAALFVALAFVRLAVTRRRSEQEAWDEYVRKLREDA